MNNNTTLWLIVFVVVIVGLLAALALQPKLVYDSPELTVYNSGKVTIPGVLIGVPTDKVEFAAITVVKAHAFVHQGDLLTALLKYIQQSKAQGLLIEAESDDGKAGALILAIDARLRDYAQKLAELLGLGESAPSQTATVGKFYVLVFIAEYSL
jgi:hypothetical protein